MSEGGRDQGTDAGLAAMQGMVEAWQKGGLAYLEAQRKFAADMSAQAEAFGLTGWGGGKEDADRLASSFAPVADMLASASKISTVYAKAGDDAATDQLANRLMGRIFDPMLWLSAVGGMDSGLERIGSGPRLADAFNVERKFAGVTKAWLNSRKQNYDHTALMLQTWMQAISSFTAILNERSGKGEKFASWRDVMSLWVETANDLLLETQRSEAFLTSQRNLVKASAELQLAQQEVGEYFGNIYGVPTRSEVDDIHKAVTELRRELRTHKRAQRSLTSGAGRTPAAEVSP